MARWCHGGGGAPKLDLEKEEEGCLDERVRVYWALLHNCKSRASPVSGLAFRF